MDHSSVSTAHRDEPRRLQDWKVTMTRVPIKGGIAGDAEYWDALDRGEFKISRCADCEAWIWPAHFRCGACGSWNIVWCDVEPKGVIYSWTRSYYVTSATKERAEDLPFVVLLVELPGGGDVRIDGVLKGAEGGLRIGAIVRGVIEPPSDKTKGYTTMAWVLDPDQDHRA